MKLARASVAGGVHHGLVEDGAFLPIHGDPFGSYERTGQELGLDDITLLHPINPRRVLVVLGGFLPAGEDSLPTGTEPRLFPKVVTEHLGPGATINRPSVLTGDLQMEAEIALVVGRRVHDVGPDEAWDAIFGFTCYNDVTAEEFVPSDLFRAKSLDGFGILGPWVSTDIKRADIHSGLSIIGRLNGRVVQSQTTARFKFDPGRMLSHASRYVTMMPGDVIALGVPPPAHPIEPGDVVEVEVEGIGALTNVCM